MPSACVLCAAAPPVLPHKAWALEHEGNVLRVSWKWSSPGALVLLPFILGAASVGTALLTGWLPGREGPLEGYAAAAFALCAALGYVRLLSSLNRTFIEVSPSTGLRVRHGPLPWFSSPLSLAPGDVRQLYGQRNEHSMRGRAYSSYELRALRADGSHLRLVAAGLTPEQVLFLERTLEAHLGIEDRPVPGELKGATS